MVILNELNEFEGDYFWLKSLGPKEALGRQLKISNGKRGLGYKRKVLNVSFKSSRGKSLFNTSILIENIFISDN